MTIYTGTADVENGSARVEISTGDPLSQFNCTEGSLVILGGVAYLVAARVSTFEFDLERDYEGATDTVGISISPVNQTTTSLVTLANVVARTQSQLNVLDKNSQGLFFTLIGSTGDNDPGPGNVAFDNADPASVGEIYVDNVDANSLSVTGLIDLWEIGTVLIIRSLTDASYAAFAVEALEDAGGYRRVSVNAIDHDGVLGDATQVSIGWSRVGEGLRIDAVGTNSDLSTYNDEASGFVFLSVDGDGDELTMSVLYRKNSSDTADWSVPAPLQGPQGYAGWAPRLGMANDDQRRVLRLEGYVGGEGPPPTAGVGQYVGPGGYTPNIASGTDVRGPVGLSAYQVAVINGFGGTESQWLTSLTAYGVAVANGFVGTVDEWLESLNGADGTDPGALFNWNTGTADADPGAGNMRADASDLSNAEFLYVNIEGRTGDDLSVFLTGIGAANNAVKGGITLTESGGVSQATFKVTDVESATGYFKLALLPGSHAGADNFTNTAPVSLQFAQAGEQGSADLASISSAIDSAPEKEAPVPADEFVIADSEDNGSGKSVQLGKMREAIGTLAHGEMVFAVSETIVPSMVGKTLIANSATAIVFDFNAAATLGAGWNAVFKNAGAGDLTLSPDGSEEIDGISDLLLKSNQSILVTCDGDGFRTFFLSEGGAGTAIAMAIVFGG